MSRKKKGGHEEAENSERWLLTYADMITLLMAFFIMMYSMSVLNLAKFREAAISIRSGFGGVMKGGGKHLMESKSEKPSEITHLVADQLGLLDAERHINTLINQKGLAGNIQVSEDKRGLKISIIADGLLFRQGAAELGANAGSLLNEVTATIKPLHNDVVVEGHTCSNPIHTPAFPSNWELSAARACRVVRYFEEHAVKDRRMAAVGYGPSRPRVPNDSEEHKALNRRVDIVVLSASLGPADYLQEPATDNMRKPRFHGVKPLIRKVFTDGAGGEGSE